MSKKRILGIDPGLNRTGFGVIDVDGSRLTFVTAGCIHVPTGTLSERLGTIFRELSCVIAETNPDCAAAEQVFVNINPRSTLLLQWPNFRRLKSRIRLSAPAEPLRHKSR